MKNLKDLVIEMGKVIHPINVRLWYDMKIFLNSFDRWCRIENLSILGNYFDDGDYEIWIWL